MYHMTESKFLSFLHEINVIGKAPGQVLPLAAALYAHPSAHP